MKKVNMKQVNIRQVIMRLNKRLNQNRAKNNWNHEMRKGGEDGSN